MNKKRAQEILNKLNYYYPKVRPTLNFSNNFELLVSVMLSAQTTDIQVNKVTKKLFPKYKGPNEGKEVENFANANFKTLESDIKSLGLYKTKAKNIKNTSKIILERFHGKVPKKLEELLLLPGVGRKTANVVLSIGFGINQGIAVDTHVKRLAIKYGFTKNTNPDKIEQDLMKLFDKKDWAKITLLLISHGRLLRKGEKDFIV